MSIERELQILVTSIEDVNRLRIRSVGFYKCINDKNRYCISVGNDICFIIFNGIIYYVTVECSDVFEAEEVDLNGCFVVGKLSDYRKHDLNLKSLRSEHFRDNDSGFISSRKVTQDSIISKLKGNW